jgi:hypothetical protein
MALVMANYAGTNDTRQGQQGHRAGTETSEGTNHKQWEKYSGIKMINENDLLPR